MACGHSALSWWRRSCCYSVSGIWYLERSRLGNLDKGEKAETYAGQAIEYARTDANYAVAHSVITIARAGDIDHLVATPVRLLDDTLRAKFQSWYPGLFHVQRNPRSLRT